MRKVEANKRRSSSTRSTCWTTRSGDFRLRVSGRSAKTAVERPGRRDQGGAVPAADHLAVPRGAGRESFQTRQGIVVPELSLGQIIFEVERCAKGRCKVEGSTASTATPSTRPILAKVKEVR